MPETMGSYELKRLLGRGGMGEVYLARDSRLDRDVALKLLPEGLAEDPVLRERFLREARAVAALNHPNIATIHEIGEADGRDFLAFEYVEGGGFDALPTDKKHSSAELIDWARSSSLRGVSQKEGRRLWRLPSACRYGWSTTPLRER